MGDDEYHEGADDGQAMAEHLPLGADTDAGSGMILEGDTSIVTPAEAAHRRRTRGGARRRAVGVLALLLGVAGVLASLGAAALVARTGFGATRAADRLLEPVAEQIGVVETRIDQADDAVDREGMATALMPELRARSEGLVDVTASARDTAATLRDHPIYGLLPADLDPLTASVDGFADGASRIEQVVAATAGNQELTGADASIVADELNTLQAGVAGAREAIDGATRSLKRWIRIGALVGVLISLWSCWAQFCLARRGFRATRGYSV
jgi:hypothetical protein